LNRHIYSTTTTTFTSTISTKTTTTTRPASKSILDVITTRRIDDSNNNEEENNSYFPLHQSQQLLNENLNTKHLVMTSQKMSTTKTVNDIFILEPDSIDYSDILNQLVMSTTTNRLYNTNNNNESNDYNYNINNLFNNSDTNILNDKISNNEDEPLFVSDASTIANNQSYIFIHSFLINLIFYYYIN